MFALVDELRTKVDGALKLAVAGTIVVLAGFATFVCFAVVLFLWTQQNYGPLEAWAALGALFLLVALAGAVVILAIRHGRRRSSELRRAPHPSLLQDPAVVVAGLQLVRMLSARGLLPLLIIGAVAGGMLMNRNGHAGRAPPADLERGPEAHAP